MFIKHVVIHLFLGGSRSGTHALLPQVLCAVATTQTQTVKTIAQLRQDRRLAARRVGQRPLLRIRTVIRVATLWRRTAGEPSS